MSSKDENQWVLLSTGLLQASLAAARSKLADFTMRKYRYKAVARVENSTPLGAEAKSPVEKGM